MQQQITKIFKAIGDPGRLRIVKMLEDKELCMCEIREVLQLSNATVSKHLSLLRDAGLVVDTKEGKWVNFALVSKPADPLLNGVLKLLKQSMNDDSQIRNDRKAVRKVCRNAICGI
jgi:ArsR family transcriptional regulator, arsenate/arsenite/antimonite-responsive transcriptional repressor